MRTFKYWWEFFIWHPLDIADRILLFVGAISGFLQKGDDPLTWALAWQIPLGAIVVFLLWRLLQLPLKIKDDIRRERLGEAPLTLENLNQRIKKIETNLITTPRLKIGDIEKKIFLKFKKLDDSGIGGIARSVAFIFEVTNASSTWIDTTGNVKGDLIILGSRVLGVYWQVFCGGIETDSEGELKIIFPVSERFAKTLAFKPIDGFFFADFSEMFIEIETRDSQQRYILGYIPIGNKCDIPFKDHMSYQKIRNIVKWENQLGEDKRITM